MDSLRSVKGRGAAVYRFRTCVRTISCAPAGACLCFSVGVPFGVKFWQGRPQPLVDVAAHGAEPDVRHVQDRVFHLEPRLLNRVEVVTVGRRATARRNLRAFSMCVPYCRIRPALTVPCFSAASCPRRICRDSQAGLPLGRSRTRAMGSSGRAAQRGPRGQNRRTGPCGMRRGGQR